MFFDQPPAERLQLRDYFFACSFCFHYTCVWIQLGANGGKNLSEDHSCARSAGRTVTYRTLYGRSFDHVNIYYDGVQGDTNSPIFNAYAFDPQGFDRILDEHDLEKLNYPIAGQPCRTKCQRYELIKSMFLLTNSQKVQESMAEARTYIRLHFADPITIPGLAKRCGMSIQRFSNNFVQTFGVRPMTFIIAKRLDHAQRLLQSGLSVRETSGRLVTVVLLQQAL